MENLDDTITRIVDAIREIPGYGEVADEAFWGDVRQAVRQNATRFFVTTIEGRVLGRDYVEAVRYFTRRRVHQGIPLESYLAAYRAGIRILWGALLDAVRGDPILQEEMLQRAVWAFRRFETLSLALTESYVAERESGTKGRDREVAALFEDVLQGAAPSEDLQARGRALGLDLEVPRRVVIVTRSSAGAAPVGSPGSALPPFAGWLAGEYDVPFGHVIEINRETEIVLLLPEGLWAESGEAAARAHLEAALARNRSPRIRTAAGVSGAVSLVDGIRQGYREAQRALELGELLDPDRSTHYYTDHVLEDALNPEGVATERLICDTLGPLLDLGEAGRRHLETLRAFLDGDGNLKVAASILHVHLNTVVYRMKQIRRILGIDLSRLDHRVRADVSLRLLALRQKRRKATSGERSGSHDPAAVRSRG